MTFYLTAARGLLCIALVALAVQCAHATTIIPVSDDDLAASSEVIVEGRCIDIRPAWNEDRTLIYSFVTFRVRRVLKGDVVPGKITLRQPGGTVGDATSILWGAPYWQVGWDMLLYLNPDQTGALRVAHLSLGYFRIMKDSRTGERYVSRPDPGFNVAIAGPGTIACTERYADRIARIEAETGIVTADPGPEPPEAFKAGGSSSNFKFLPPGFKWFEPDQGGRVHYRVNPQMAPTPSRGMDEARASVEAWSTVPGSNLRAEIDGQTDACGLRSDGVDSISFNDCTGMFDPPINCTGVVALGGVAEATPSESVSIGGRTFARIKDADVTFNTGFECLLSNPPVVQELMTHELGHTFGFGHSSEDVRESNALLRDATMFFIAHLDSRGASLKEDDQDAARFLYRSPVTPAPLSIETEDLPEAPVGAPYSFQLVAKGTGPFTWSLDSGALPAGLSLSQNGTITGTASATEDATFTVRVRDVANFDFTRTLWLRASPNPAPFVVSATFKSSKTRLIITALNVDGTAQVSVNGTAVAPPLTVKFKAAKNQLIISGAAADLNVRNAAPNAIVVTLNGLTSNEFEF